MSHIEIDGKRVEISAETAENFKKLFKEEETTFDFGDGPVPVSEDARVYDTVWVFGNAVVCDTACVFRDDRVCDGTK